MNEDRASRYHRLRRRAVVASTLACAAWLAWLLASGAAAFLASRLNIALFIIIVAAGCELAALPFEFYRNFLLDRKYALSAESLTTWLGDHLKALGIGLVLTLGAGLAVYGAISVAGALWWMLAALLFALAGIALSRLAPVLLMPLFYRFRPLDREELTARLLSLTRRAGVPVLGVFEWALGEKTTRANAALVGMGPTRRILLSDTLLKDYSDDEIEVILAHELAHHVHHDVWTGLAIETLIVAIALYAAGAVVAVFGPRLGIASIGNPAGLPLMALAGGGASLVLTPLANAWSRHNERQADRYALALTRQPAPFISAMKRLGAQNLAEERPSAPVFWFFHTHPTIEQRIEAARAAQLTPARPT
jgi:Zn-dependent protease with chaperone function